MTPQERHEREALKHDTELTRLRDNLQREISRLLLGGGLLFGAMAMLFIIALCGAVTP